MQPIFRVKFVKDGETHVHTTPACSDVDAGAKIFRLYGWGITLISAEEVKTEKLTCKCGVSWPVHPYSNMLPPAHGRPGEPIHEFEPKEG